MLITPTTKPVFLKESNLNLIKSGKIEGTKIKAYERLLSNKGNLITKGRLKGGKLIYLGFDDYIGGLFTHLKSGVVKVNHIEAKIS